MNSLAIRHSKKHRQSLSVVSWLSEAVLKSALLALGRPK